MGKPASAIGDIAGHAGAIATGSLNVLIGGRPAARKGDTIICPLHGAGVIALGSFTVLINGMGAARLGDLTGCIVPGLAPISIPIPMLGPPALPAPPTPPAQGAAPIQGALGLGASNNQMHAVTDKSKDGVTAMHMEGSITDADGDGAYDTMEGSVEGARMRNAGQVNKGRVELGGTHSMDIMYANARVSSVGPQAVSGSAEAGMMKWGLGGTIGAKDSKGLNPALGISGEANLMHAKAEADMLTGSDGNRVGIIRRAEAGAEALKGEAGAVTTIPLWGGNNIQIGGKVSGALATVGGGAGLWLYYNKKEGRMHGGIMGILKVLVGLGAEVDVSIGRAYQPESPPEPSPPVAQVPGAGNLFGGYANTPGFGAGGLPGAIMLGNPMVLIGG